ncbi:MAG TPA: radical SAM protein [Rhodocyclaceae bacterium]|nr:radical SAM protein [Rhodocyclaceae bacterium]
MTINYRTTLNVEWTSKCNALCPMCPRDKIEHPRSMRPETWQQTLARIKPAEVVRVVVAGYGEPTTHPRFYEMVNDARRHPVRFDMATNGHLLDEEKIRHLDGAFGLLLVSFSSIDPVVYGKVHAKLDQARVMENIKAAKRLLKHTALAISLTPMPECLPSLPDTIGWLRSEGVTVLTMSPTLYNRGGSLQEHQLATRQLRRLIKEHGLQSQEMPFIPSATEVFRQWTDNSFKCIPRNIDLFISSDGEYLYCYNDIGHKHAIGHVAGHSVHEVLARRQRMSSVEELCAGCNLRDRYGAAELAKVGASYAAIRLQDARKAFGL